MNAVIRIKGTQTVDGESDIVELTTDGTFDREEDGWCIRYEEAEAAEGEETATTLHITPERVMLERVGPFGSMLILEKGKRHHCTYNTPYGILDMGTYANDIRTRLTEKGGNLFFAYTLGFNGNIASAHTVEVQVTAK